MGKDPKQIGQPPEPPSQSQSNPSKLDLAAAEATLQMLAEVFAQNGALNAELVATESESSVSFSDEDRYRTLVDQLPAVVFMASLEKGIGNAYVSPQIEAALGFSQNEWLQDPIRWYEHIHPDDKARWSIEAAEMFHFRRHSEICVPGDRA
jgi:PAS domain-containing protein